MAIIVNKRDLVTYLIVWIAFIILQTLSVHSVSALQIELLFVDAFVRSVLLVPTAILIHNAIKYVEYGKIPIIQQIINYFALTVISVSFWLILGYVIVYLLTGSEFVQKLLEILPFYISTGFMLFLIMILFLRNKTTPSKSLETIKENINIDRNINENNDIPPAANAEILEHIAVKSGQKIHIIPVSDIFYLQAFGDYVYIFTNTGKYLKEQTMKYFENNLPIQFIRIHRSYIVNIESISRIERYEKQNQLLTLKNGHKIKISTTGYKLLRQKLNL
jgi:hypothetical protein